MRGKDKYPSTATFTYYNANPHNRIAGDCVIRAIATATETSWEDTVMGLTKFGIKHGYVCNDVKCFSKYLEKIGWYKHSQPRKEDNKKYTGEEFCEYLNKLQPKYTRIVANIGGNHTVAIIKKNGRYTVHDIWNSTDGCIGNYWAKY